MGVEAAGRMRPPAVEPWRWRGPASITSKWQPPDGDGHDGRGRLDQRTPRGAASLFRRCRASGLEMLAHSLAEAVDEPPSGQIAEKATGHGRVRERRSSYYRAPKTGTAPVTMRSTSIRSAT